MTTSLVKACLYFIFNMVSGLVQKVDNEIQNLFSKCIL